MFLQSGFEAFCVNISHNIRSCGEQLLASVLRTQYFSGDETEANEMGGSRSAYGGRGEAYIGFWWRNLRERDHLEDPCVYRKIMLRCIFRKWYVGEWTGSSWFLIGTGGGYLWVW